MCRDCRYQGGSSIVRKIDLGRSRGESSRIEGSMGIEAANAVEIVHEIGE
jgi:hypothetical protein